VYAPIYFQGSSVWFSNFRFTKPGFERLGVFLVLLLGGSLLLPPAFGTLGNTAPGTFRSIGLKLWDASLTKDVHFTERLSGQFRFEVFNVLNHVNYTPSVSATMAAGVGTSTTTLALPTGSSTFGSARATPDVQVSNPSVGSGAPRGFQMGLKLSY